MIRAATEADLDHIVGLVAEFHSVPRWPWDEAFRAEDFRETARLILQRGVIFLSERGLIGLTVSPSLYNHKQATCSELFFWAPDGQGDALRRAAEAWAKNRAQIIIMSAHEPGPVARILNWYRRKGYVPIGRQVAKGL